MIRIAKGGSHAISNLATLCSECHEKHHGHDILHPGSEQRTTKRQKIDQAFQESRQLEIRYRKKLCKKCDRTMGEKWDRCNACGKRITSRDVEVTTRTIDIYYLEHFEDNLYAVAYCHLENGPRVFRIDRIQQSKILASSFRRDPSIASDMQKRFPFTREFH